MTSLEVSCNEISMILGVKTDEHPVLFAEENRFDMPSNSSAKKEAQLVISW